MIDISLLWDIDLFINEKEKTLEFYRVLLFISFYFLY